MTSSFGLNGVALIHMLQAISQEVPIVFVDTGYLFAETLETKRRIEAAYGVQVLTYHPRCNGDGLPHPGAISGQTAGSGGNSQAADLCCAVRKVEPMSRAIAELRPVAVLNARARFQANTRQGLPTIEWDQTPIYINPLAYWTQQQIEEYVRAHHVPYNPLHDRGYPSIGCWPCTRPVKDGEHLRAGRWAGLGKLECGLWTQVARPGPMLAVQKSSI
jgi:phosphoadenosine phosphosulfate reductase